MRTVLTLIAAMFLMTGAAIAQDTGTSQPKQNYVRRNLRPNAVLAQNFAGKRDIGSDIRVVNPNKSERLLNDNTCYTMHSLLVAKRRNSDETEIVKQRTCTPATQFQVKTTEESPK
jgi:hypothetical protein